MDLATFLISALATFLGFFVQTITGFAAGLIAVPILLFVFPLPEAIALMSVFFFIFSAIMVWKNWDDVDKKTVWELAVGIIIGLTIGIYLLKISNPIILRKIFGVFIVLFVFYTSSRNIKVKIFEKLGFIFGTLAGFSSGMFSSGGQFLIVYIYNKLDRPKLIRATIIGGLAISNTLRVPLMIASDILTYKIFIKSLYLLPIFLVTLYLSHKLYKKINEKTLKRIILIFLFISGVLLIAK